VRYRTFGVRIYSIVPYHLGIAGNLPGNGDSSTEKFMKYSRAGDPTARLRSVSLNDDVDPPRREIVLVYVLD
jgi:hypothetical protein